MNFATKIRNLRLSRKMSQMELANRLNLSQSIVTAWENGSRLPSRESMKRIAESMGVSYSFLANDEEVDQDLLEGVASSIQRNPKLRVLFDRVRAMSDQDIDVMNSVARAITKELDNE